MKDQKGVIHAELLILALLLVAFCAGTIRVSRSHRARFERIVEERNASIRELRSKTQRPPEFLPAGHILPASGGGSDEPSGR
jgi:hypothetical protein